MPKSETAASKRKQRKRNRVPISCTICRRRKVKCDKKKPCCTNCMKNNVAQLCRYLEPSWAKPLDKDELQFPGTTVSNFDVSLQDENAQLKKRVKELELANLELKKSRIQPLSVDSADLLDCISNSNVLFTAKRGPVYHFPVTYEISVMSWMFIVRNDSYLNDLWLKIIKLRKHYEYYYSSKNAMVDASKSLATDYTNFSNKIGRIDVSEKTSEHTSKLKGFLETMRLEEDGQHKKLVINKCPVLHPGESTMSYEDLAEDDVDAIDDPKVCPLMIGDARALFKEKLSQMNMSALRETAKKTEAATPTPALPVTPPTSHPSPRNAKKRSAPTSKTTGKRLRKSKMITPSAVKGLNYNNTKEVIAVVEKYLPSRKVVWLLIDRFFEKLYLHLPYVDEETFRLRTASIIGTADAESQTIRLKSIGSQYCEEFLSVCLMLIVIRLSWLSLPEKISDSLTAEEKLMLKPENMVTMVLVDMVKEIFSSAKIMGKPSLIIFQVGLFLKFYNIFSPEDGFDLDDSFTSNNKKVAMMKSNDLSGDLTNETPNMNSPNFMAMLVQLARNIGLNRDPLNFSNFYSSTADPITNARLFRKRHLWRKLWFGLLYLSIESNMSMGDYKKGLPIELDVDPTLGAVNKTWDCRLPGGVEQGVLEKSFYGPALEKEQIVVNNFRDSIVVYHLMYKAMSALFCVDTPPSTKAVSRIMTKLLELVSDKSKVGLDPSFLLSGDAGSTSLNTRGRNALNNTRYGKYARIFRMRLCLLAKSLLFTLNYLLFLNHEQKFSRLIADKSSTLPRVSRQKQYIDTYFEGSLLMAIDNFNLFIQLVDHSAHIFPNCGAAFILYPFLLVLNHRSHEFLISLILRLQQDSPIVCEILKKNGIDKDELLKRLFHYLSAFLDKLETLTKSYYYAWRLKKMVKFFYNILTNSKKLFSINFSRMNQSIKDEPEGSTLMSDERQQTSQQPSQQPPVKAEPASAFEIAFGTSKLPPVTDFADANEALYGYYQQDGVAAPAPDSVQQPAARRRVLRAPENNVSESQPTPDFSGGPIDDVFADNFFSDLNEVSMGGLANDPMDTMAYGSFQVADPGLGMAEGSSNGQMIIPHSTMLGNGFVSGAYNSLNEIDFTNVDLNSQFDDSSGMTSNLTPDENSRRLGLGGLNLRFNE